MNLIVAYSTERMKDIIRRKRKLGFIDRLSLMEEWTDYFNFVY
jgi:hypothetical protein